MRGRSSAKSISSGTTTHESVVEVCEILALLSLRQQLGEVGLHVEEEMEQAGKGGRGIARHLVERLCSRYRRLYKRL